MKRNWIRGIIGGLSFTTALFVFQACYGTPQDMGLDVYITGRVKSRSNGSPIRGIKVTVTNTMQYEMTNDEGYFSMFTEMSDKLAMSFEDIDSTANGSYANKDTVINIGSGEIHMEVSLEDN
jgi:hypothetical protein